MVFRVYIVYPFLVIHVRKYEGGAQELGVP